MLEGVKIIDFTLNIAGPTASALATDYGATVTNVEPQTGDISRVNMLEELIEHMKSKPGVAIGPALDISRLAIEGMGE